MTSFSTDGRILVVFLTGGYASEFAVDVDEILELYSDDTDDMEDVENAVNADIQPDEERTPKRSRVVHTTQTSPFAGGTSQFLRATLNKRLAGVTATPRGKGRRRFHRNDDEEKLQSSGELSLKRMILIPETHPFSTTPKLASLRANPLAT